jgi:hypothetical protein
MVMFLPEGPVPLCSGKTSFRPWSRQIDAGGCASTSGSGLGCACVCLVFATSQSFAWRGQPAATSERARGFAVPVNAGRAGGARHGQTVPEPNPRFARGRRCVSAGAGAVAHFSAGVDAHFLGNCAGGRGGAAGGLALAAGVLALKFFCPSPFDPSPIGPLGEGKLPPVSRGWDGSIASADGDWLTIKKRTATADQPWREREFLSPFIPPLIPP